MPRPARAGGDPSLGSRDRRLAFSRSRARCCDCPAAAGAIEAVDVSESGLVAGVFSTSRYLGSIAGISLFAGALAPAATGAAGFRPLFVMVTGAAAGSAALSFLLPDRPRVVGAMDAEAAG
jgi:hypothetical protein